MPKSPRQQHEGQQLPALPLQGCQKNPRHRLTPCLGAVAAAEPAVPSFQMGLKKTASSDSQNLHRLAPAAVGGTAGGTPAAGSHPVDSLLLQQVLGVLLVALRVFVQSCSIDQNLVVAAAVATDLAAACLRWGQVV